jgi:indole-3-acetate monooxygenase
VSRNALPKCSFDCFCDIASDEIPFGVKTPFRKRSSAQIDVARAEAQIDSARCYVYETVEALWSAVEQGHAASDEARRRVRLAGIHAAAAAASAVDLLYHAAGASAIADTCPLQRHFRDVHVVTQHLHVSSAGFERMGRLRLTGELEGLL